MMKRMWRRLKSERGSVYLEYAMVTTITLALASLFFNPSSFIFKGIGLDYEFREALIKLPIF